MMIAKNKNNSCHCDVEEENNIEGEENNDDNSDDEHSHNAA